MTVGSEMWTWEDIATYIASLDVHEKITIEKSALPPMPSWLKWRIGYILNEYSMTLPDGRGIHVKVFPEHYVIEWDYADPNTDLLGHFKKDLSLFEQIVIGGLAVLGADHFANDGKIRKSIIGR